MSSPRLLLAAALLAACSAPAPRVRAPLPRFATGDLLFLDLDCGELCDAIEEVTLAQFSVPAPRLSHVGIVELGVDGTPALLEAWPPRVTRTPLGEALARARPGGRYLIRLPGHGARAAAAARRWLGLPYDEDFLLGNGQLYCSELVHESYRGAAGEPLFAAIPMRFGEPGSRARAAWERHYRARGRRVPEGEPGLSPLGVYLRSRALGGAVQRW